MKVGLLYGPFSSNLGDVAVTSGAVELLERFGRPAEIRIVVPVWTEGQQAKARAYILDRHAGVVLTALDRQLAPCLRRLSPSKTLPHDTLEGLLSEGQEILRRSGIADCDLLVYRGGEHLFAQTEQQSVALTARVAPLIAGWMQGRRVICLPSTLGPYGTPLARATARSFVASCHELAFRESTSRAHLTEIGLASERIGSFPSLLDPAFFIRVPNDAIRSPTADHGPVTIVARLDGAGLRVGRAASRRQLMKFKLFGYRFSRSFGFYLDTMASMLDGGDEDLRILVQVNSDRELAERLMVALRRRCPRHVHRVRIVQPATLDDYLRTLSESRLVVSSRFHSIVFALMLGCPVIGVWFPEHGHKIPGLMEMFGLQHFTVEGSRPASGRALALCREIVAERQRWSTENGERLQSLRSKTEQWIGASILPRG